MKTTTERFDVTDQSGNSVGFHESATIHHNGQSFTSGGAHVDPDRAIAYPKFLVPELVGTRGDMTDWKGNRIGSARIVASWSVQSVWGSRMFQIESTINGVAYTGRGFGSGMIWRGRRKARQ